MENLLGFEFSEDKIKVLEVSLEQGVLSPLFLGSIDLPAQSTKEAAIVEPKNIADKISAFIKDNKLFAKKAVALVGPPYIFSRLIFFPQNLSDNQIRLNLEAEVKQYKVFSGKEIVVDFKKLEEVSEEGKKKVNVLFGAAAKALSDSYLKTLEAAGIDLLGIDAPLFSILRLLNGVDLDSSSLDVVLLITISYKYIEMVIIKGNRPRFMHAVEIDMFDFDREPDNFIDRLVSAIKLAINFYQARLILGEEINRIVINPLHKKYKQLHALLQEKLPQITVQLANPLAKIRINPAKPLAEEELRFSFSPLLGACLMAENKSLPFDLNLLLEQKAVKHSYLSQVYLLFMSLASLLGIAIILMLFLVIRIGVLQYRIGKISAQLENPSSSLNKLITIQERRNILKNKMDEAFVVTSKIENPSYFKSLAKVMVLAPQGLWFTDIETAEDGRILILNCESRIEKPIFNFIASLTDSGYFEAVEVTSSKSAGEYFKFTVRCKI